eukprot:CAMPEP_0175221944 /NCGR_PEP_ID=MMETSP0093-20121207/20567_1 /TAXON_ID=311494 /ORGANISM="Alexandrium monilatum, Strain CCMP3105" /LENGTH=129 /DNA_ID=CAMNT_0016515511 /DNA_START=80 /DNA_END=470 /DNA_ORIENTATION=-
MAGARALTCLPEEVAWAVREPDDLKHGETHEGRGDRGGQEEPGREREEHDHEGKAHREHGIPLRLVLLLLGIAILLCFLLAVALRRPLSAGRLHGACSADEALKCHAAELGGGGGVHVQDLSGQVGSHL